MLFYQWYAKKKGRVDRSRQFKLLCSRFISIYEKLTKETKKEYRFAQWIMVPTMTVRKIDRDLVHQNFVELRKLKNMAASFERIFRDLEDFANSASKNLQSYKFFQIDRVADLFDAFNRIGGANKSLEGYLDDLVDGLDELSKSKSSSKERKEWEGLIEEYWDRIQADLDVIRKAIHDIVTIEHAFEIQSGIEKKCKYDAMFSEQYLRKTSIPYFRNPKNFKVLVDLLIQLMTEDISRNPKVEVIGDFFVYPQGSGKSVRIAFYESNGTIYFCEPLYKISRSDYDGNWNRRASRGSKGRRITRKAYSGWMPSIYSDYKAVA